ncbi:BMP family ABC transporter substrate-binding protein [Isoptericola sp. AK164]|uniref:BMP family lipoprotein n=1 Tax=Isoptericola sp. AK164 TaxID=3024246 RepID=UPI0024181D94|nr:BMP family ABC transporter substrate-binding protein [Isoptericola sp. AK164]
MKSAIKFTALAGAAALTLAACGAAPEETPTEETTETEMAESESVDYQPCIVSDQGGFDDKSFNQLSYEGTQAAAEELGQDVIDVQSQSETDFQPNLQSLVDQSCDAIVSVGFALSADTIESANANPEIDYFLVDDAADADFDGQADADNIKPLLYNTAEAAFLAGYLSAGYSEAGKVGTFGGQPFPTVTIFMDGFKQGVEYYNEANDAEVEVIGYSGGEDGSFTGGFEANQTAKTTATNILDQGVDVILPVGGPIYQSAIAAIEDSGRDVALVGVDADFYETDPSTQPYVLTSILKKMDVSTHDALMTAATEEFDPEPYIGTLENEGVGLAPLHEFEDEVDPELMSEVEDLQQQIIDGELEVTSYLDE